MTLQAPLSSFKPQNGTAILPPAIRHPDLGNRASP
jgi:hypothetical protein